METLWWIPAAPLAAFAINAAVALATSRPGRTVPRGLVGFVACAGPLLAFVGALLVFIRLRELDPSERHITEILYTWIASGSLKLDAALTVDALSGLMLLVITGVGTLIHCIRSPTCTRSRVSRATSRISPVHVRDDRSRDGDNFRSSSSLEGVGLCSYLLIGFW